MRCPDCSGETTRRIEDYHFEYGNSPAIPLEARIEVHTCKVCGFEFTAQQAEQVIGAVIEKFRHPH